MAVIRCWLVLVFFSLSLCALAEAEVIVPPGGMCPSNTNFEKAGYTIRSVRLTGPFAFLRWLREELGEAREDLSWLEGQPFRYADVNKAGDEFDRRSFDADAPGQRIGVAWVITSVENCVDGQLDVVYSVFSTQIAPVLSGTFESRRAEVGSPSEVAGAGNVTNRFRLAPNGGYDRSERLYGGGRIEYRLSSATPQLLPLDSLVVEGQGSSTMHRVSADLAGSTDTDGNWLAHGEWQLNYLNASEPTDESSLRQHRLAAQFMAITRPLGEWRLPVRYGGLLEAGRLESDFRAAELPRNTVASSGYGASKLYAGTTTRLAHQVFAVSYGVELGSTGGARVDWVKQVGDVAHDLFLPVADHVQLQIESRLTAGLLQVPGAVPVTARFFGGNREQSFMPGDAWTIRSNPVVRSIPANRFDRTADGPGGTRFVAYNLTAAIPIWRKPLVPSELSRDPEFTNKLTGAMETATSLVQVDYLARDPNFKLAAGRIADVRTVLARLKAAVTEAKTNHPDQFEKSFTGCTKAIGTAERRAKAAAESKGSVQYGNVAALLSADPDEDHLAKVLSACVADLNTRLGDATITMLAKELPEIRKDMEDKFEAVDKCLARQQAKSEMTYVDRTIHTMVHDWNLFAVSPIVIFDVAHLGPANAEQGTRYAVGGGLRLTLASYVDFTVGYAANPSRRPRERPGAFFFTIQFRDLLG